MEKTNNDSKKNEIGTAYIIEKGIFKIVPLYNESEFNIVDKILGKNKEKLNLNKFLKKPISDHIE